MSKVDLLKPTKQGSGYFYIAFIFSVFLHVVIVKAEFFKVETIQAPAQVIAAPLLTNVIASLSSPKHTINKPNIGMTQQGSEISKPQTEKVEETNEQLNPDVLATSNNHSEFKADKNIAKADNKKPPEVGEKNLDKKDAKKQNRKLENSLAKKKITKQTEDKTQKQAKAMPTVKDVSLSNTAAIQQQGPLNNKGEQEKLSWQQMLYLQLEKEKRYPRSARRMRRQGIPTITFTMNRSGKVLDVYLVNSSGTDSLDKEAVAMVYRAEPLPQPPASVAGVKLTLTVPISFAM